MKGFLQREGSYNPDVLSCLANLSNDEVFTSPALANQMIDLLPPEIFRNPKTTFLDPACKTGVFLREIAKRLMVGLSKAIPDEEKRREHIFKKQLFGVAITELTALMSRRSVYCSKNASCKYSVVRFASPAGNIRFKQIRHSWENERCKYCGVSQRSNNRDAALESHAYEFIHTLKPEEIFNMHFDVIIGNPPYQMYDGGNTGGAMPIYNYFVEQAMKLNPRFLVMIIPSRWFAGGRGLGEFRDKMRHDHRIKVLVDYPKSRDCFTGVDIAGGVCYFLWDRQYDGPCTFCSRQNDHDDRSERYIDEFDVIIRDSRGVDIIHKIQAKGEKSLATKMLTVSPFGLRSFVRGKATKGTGDIAVISSNGKGYIKRSDVTKNVDVIDKHKLYVGYLNPDRAGVNNAADGKSNVVTKIKFAKPGEVLTETYIVPFYDASSLKVHNCATYLATKFVRLLVLLTLSSMHITQANFAFVPMQDFTKAWSDEELYAKYGLTSEEIGFIESMIRPMEAGE